ncbi:MAG: SHOCT domain-containing protein [Chloroflexota bacterium]|nr:SHOCT domain-containing protein [Chloroflexota bacterium]
MNWDYMMNGWMRGWMWIPTVLIVALLILGVIALVRGLSAVTPREVDDPLAIAARRFARSEISKDEYETLRSTLSR